MYFNFLFRKQVIFISLIVISSSFGQSGYNISLKLNKTRDSIAYLTFYNFDKTFIKDTCKIDKNGKILFSGKNKLETGIYSFVNQGKSIYFDFFVDEKNQYLEFENNDSEDKIDGLTVINSQTQSDFIEYLKYINLLNKDFDTFKLNNKLITKKDSVKFKEKQESLDKQILEYEKMFYEKHKLDYIGKVIKLKIENKINDFFKNSTTKQDSIKAYYSYKNQFWKNIDLKDESIIRNPFFYNKMKRYFENVVISNPDTLAIEIDKFLEKTDFKNLTYKTLLSHFIYSYETSKIMGFDKVFVHLVDKYVKTGKAAEIYDVETIKKIQSRSDIIKPLLLGVVAPDLNMIKASDFSLMKNLGFESAKNSEELTRIYYSNLQKIEKLYVNLHSLKADYIILVFWDVDCGHCKKEIPKLKEIFDQIKNKNVKLYSAYTGFDGDKFINFIETEKLQDWINVYDGAHVNNLLNKYDIYSTPVIYILDSSKKIIAKRISIEQIKDIIKY